MSSGATEIWYAMVFEGPQSKNIKILARTFFVQNTYVFPAESE